MDVLSLARFRGRDAPKPRSRDGARFRPEREGPSNSLTPPDDAVLDAALSYRRGRLCLDLNFKNLTDERYFNGNGIVVYPAEPFSVLRRVAWSF